MKISFIFSVVLTATITQLFAQKQLKVKYAETQFFDQALNLPPQVVANMPKSREVKKILLTNDSSSVYITNKEDVSPETSAEETGRRFNRRKEADAIVYNNLNAGTQVTFTELFGKEFLIEESTDIKWKLFSGEQREILKHTCIKATTMKDTTLVTAWFAADITPAFGPNGYHGLPGLILALSEGDSKVILATALEVDPEKPFAVDPPTKGEKINRTDFEKLRKEKIQEMQQMWGGQRGNPRMYRN